MGCITSGRARPQPVWIFLRGKNNRKRNDINEVNLGEYASDTVGPHQHKVRVFDPNANDTGAGILWDGGKRFRFGFNQLVAGLDDAKETQPKNVTVNYFIKINN